MRCIALLLIIIKQYGSVNKMKQATVEELEKILPKEVAKNLYEFLKDFKYAIKKKYSII